MRTTEVEDARFEMDASRDILAIAIERKARFYAGPARIAGRVALIQVFTINSAIQTKTENSNFWKSPNPWELHPGRYLE